MGQDVQTCWLEPWLARYVEWIHNSKEEEKDILKHMFFRANPNVFIDNSLSMCGEI